MIFPVVELKFCQVIRTPAITQTLVRLYRVDDGGLDPSGNQIYVRTLRRERVLNLDAGWDRPRLLAAGQARLAQWNVELGFNLTPDRLICTL